LGKKGYVVVVVVVVSSFLKKKQLHHHGKVAISWACTTDLFS